MGGPCLLGAHVQNPLRSYRKCRSYIRFRHQSRLPALANPSRLDNNSLRLCFDELVALIIEINANMLVGMTVFPDLLPSLGPLTSLNAWYQDYQDWKRGKTGSRGSHP